MVQSWVLGSSSAVRSGHIDRRTSRKVNPTGSPASRNVSGSGWRAARFSFLVVCFLVLFAGFSWMRTFASEPHVTPATASEQVIIVDTGDTLWSLAAGRKKASMDTREAVQRIMERNELTSSSLESGQVLIVPDSILP